MCKSSKKHSFFPAATSIMCAETKEWSRASTEKHSRPIEWYIRAINKVVISNEQRCRGELWTKMGVSRVPSGRKAFRPSLNSDSLTFGFLLLSLLFTISHRCHDLLIHSHHVGPRRCPCCQGAFSLLWCGRTNRSCGCSTRAYKFH